MRALLLCLALACAGVLTGCPGDSGVPDSPGADVPTIDGGGRDGGPMDGGGGGTDGGGTGDGGGGGMDGGGGTDGGGGVADGGGDDASGSLDATTSDGGGGATDTGTDAPVIVGLDAPRVDAPITGLDAGSVCTMRPPLGCCFNDLHCGGAGRLGRCVNETCRVGGAGTCVNPALTAGQCWEDSDCRSGTCTGARICPCGAMCLLPDAPGTCG